MWPLGDAGAYINRTPSTSRPNVSSVNQKQVSETRSLQELFDAIERSTGRRNLATDLASYDPATHSTVGDQMPNYGEFLSDDRIWELVKFLKQEAVDTDERYDFTTSGTYPAGTWTRRDHVPGPVTAQLLFASGTDLNASHGALSRKTPTYRNSNYPTDLHPRSV